MQGGGGGGDGRWMTPPCHSSPTYAAVAEVGHSRSTTSTLKPQGPRWTRRKMRTWARTAIDWTNAGKHAHSLPGAEVKRRLTPLAASLGLPFLAVRREMEVKMAWRCLLHHRARRSASWQRSCCFSDFKKGQGTRGLASARDAVLALRSIHFSSPLLQPSYSALFHSLRLRNLQALLYPWHHVSLAILDEDAFSPSVILLCTSFESFPIFDVSTLRIPLR